MKKRILLFFVSFAVLPAWADRDMDSWCPQADLSEEQKRAVHQHFQAFRENRQGLDREQLRELRQRRNRAVVEEGTTAEQQGVLESCLKKKRKGKLFCPAADLSEEQRTEIKEIRKNFREAVKGKDRPREDRRAERERFHQALAQVGSTEAQREAITQCLEQRREKRKRHKKEKRGKRGENSE